MAPRFRRLTLPLYPADFNVYYCASALVRVGDALHLYQGADTGADPQRAIAPADSAIDRIAKSQGLAFVGLYVYPPVLANLLVPYTFFNIAQANHLWLLTNGFFLLVTALLITKLLRWPVLSWQAGIITLALACFTPALQCLVDGQITIFLLLLWTAGMLLFQREQEGAAGIVFALATSIKLTPAIVLLAFLLWRKWRCVTAFVASLILLALLCAWIDTPQALHTYFGRVLPAMSGAVPFYSNYSLPSSIQRFITLIRTGAVLPSPGVLPASTVLAGRIASAAATLGLFALVARSARTCSRQDQVLILGLLSLMAPVLSPVSWFHAYTTAFVAFAVLWRECFQKPHSSLYLLALVAVSVTLGSAVSENLIPFLLAERRDAASSLLHLGQLVAALALVSYRIWRIPLRIRSVPGLDVASVLTETQVS